MMRVCVVKTIGMGANVGNVVFRPAHTAMKETGRALYHTSFWNLFINKQMVQFLCPQGSGCEGVGSQT